MSIVSVVCTVHKEAEPGITVSALHAILEGLQPEVIFLETPPAAFDDYYESCADHNLESRAVRLYRERHPEVKLVPVDLRTPTADFFANFERVRQAVRTLSLEYRQLMSLDYDRVRRYGFYYLNSDYCNDHWSNIYAEMTSTLKKLNNPELLEIYDLWNKTHDLREKAMVESIEKYCSANTVARGVFLVGAAHRQAVMALAPQWDFAGHVKATTPEPTYP
jgi:hypothetical protein